VEGVATVSSLGWGEMRVDGADTNYSSVDPSTAEQVLNLDVSAGEIADLAGGGVMVARKAADEHGWKVGDTVSAEFPATGAYALEVVAVYDSKGFIASDFVLANEAQLEYAGSRLDTNALVLVEEGADLAEVQARVADALVEHPDAVVLDQDGYEEVAGGFVDKLLAFVTILLLLAVVIALLGIVNTLALSVYERTRELGLLRAVGMTQSQVRAMVRWESVVISVLGASFGAVLGIGLGAALAKAMADQGITAVSVPGPQIALYVGAAAVAGLLAAVGPARRAAKVDVLRAVVTD
jgi:putative ABC transport system permease protein